LDSLWAKFGAKVNEEIPSIVLLVGAERLSVEQAEKKLLDRAFGGGSPGFNLATFSAADGAERAIEAARTVPMMAKRRVVIIREMESAPVGLLDDLMLYAERPVPSTMLMLIGRKLPPAQGGQDRGRKLENRIKKVGQVRRFKSGERDPVRFSVERAREYGCDFDSGAARLLVELVGADLGRLQTETDKLVNYCGEQARIDRAAVEAVCSVVAEAIVWDLTDALVRRDPNQALAVAHRLLEDGESPHRLLAMITWQFRQLLNLQACLVQGVNPRDAGVRMPRYKLEAAQQALRRQPIDGVWILDRLAKSNRDFNRSRAGDRRVFENLLVGLTAS
jgi:DNA polymerase III delta subunit